MVRQSRWQAAASRAPVYRRSTRARAAWLGAYSAHPPGLTCVRGRVCVLSQRGCVRMGVVGSVAGVVGAAAAVVFGLLPLLRERQARKEIPPVPAAAAGGAPAEGDSDDVPVVVGEVPQEPVVPAPAGLLAGLDGGGPGGPSIAMPPHQRRLVVREAGRAITENPILIT
jgi:hypothetical protein